VRVAAALLEKASWPATARHAAGMASFQANPLTLTKRVRTRLSSRSADRRAADNCPHLRQEGIPEPEIAEGNLATSVFRGQGPIKRVIARPGGRCPGGPADGALTSGRLPVK